MRVGPCSMDVNSPMHQQAHLVAVHQVVSAPCTQKNRSPLTPTLNNHESPVQLLFLFV